MRHIKYMALPFLLIAMLFAAGCNSDSSGGGGNDSGAHAEYRMGALLPLTGSLADLASTFKVALEQAAAEHPDVEFTIKDCNNSGPDAQEAMAEFKDMGITMVLGPVGSETADWATTYADQHGQTLLSCTSTAQGLAKPNDSLMRFSTPDSFQAKVLTERLIQDNISHIFVFLQSDIYGAGLFDHLKAEFEALGGVVAGVYDMRGAYALEDMRYKLDTFVLELNGLLETVYESRIGVVTILYEEAVNLFAAADDYDGLHRLKWYGSDSLAQSNILTNTAKAAAFASRANFLCPIVAEFDNPEYAGIKDSISQEIGGVANVYAVMYYDAFHIVANAMKAASNDNPETLREAIRTEAASYVGGSGPILLNADDDRSNHSVYDFWKIDADGGGYAWFWDSQIVLPQP